MKTLEKYQCEYCHTEYREKSACERCEKNHKVKSKIKKTVYQSYEIDRSGYPMRINIEFENGETITYKRG